MFAVIELQGHQYIVRKDDTIVVDKLELTDSNYVADKVLLIAEEDGSSVTVGSPYVAGATVSFDVVTDFQKGEKVRVVKFKRKNRYQRTIGFRPHQTVLLVTSIGGEGKKVKSSEKVEKIESEDLTVVEDEKVEKAVKKATPKAKPTK